MRKLSALCFLLPCQGFENCSKRLPFRENANWQEDTIREIYKQADSGGILLSSMGNPKPLPVYWDKLLLNASQVTNPSLILCGSPWKPGYFWGKSPCR